MLNMFQIVQNILQVEATRERSTDLSPNEESVFHQGARPKRTMIGRFVYLDLYHTSFNLLLSIKCKIMILVYRNF